METANLTPCVDLQGVTLDRSRLFAASTAAPKGEVHIVAPRKLSGENGEEYQRADQGVEGWMNDADICEDARKLFDKIAQRLADQNGCGVKSRREPAAALVQPAAK